MAHKAYVSFKAEDMDYRDKVLELPNLDCIHKRFTTPINSDNEDYILECIREEYLSDSTVTIHLIGLYGSDDRGWDEQKFIKRELRASLFDGKNNTKNGILGIVLPDAVSRIYKGDVTCATCGGTHNLLTLNNSTTIREFSYNYFIPNGKCYWPDEDRYCVLATWDEFCKSPTSYVDKAFDKREAPIASKTLVRPS